MNGSTLADIHAVMDTLEFENDGHIVLRHVSNDQNNIVLLINIKTGVDDAPDQRWQITCVDVRAHRLALQAYCDINISNDYVLLWPYLMPQTAISFYGHIDDPLPIIVRYTSSILSLWEHGYHLTGFSTTLHLSPCCCVVRQVCWLKDRNN